MENIILSFKSMVHHNVECWSIQSKLFHHLKTIKELAIVVQK